ncbi:MAG: caspase family protein, partial [Roseiarcus sp.]
MGRTAAAATLLAGAWLGGATPATAQSAPPRLAFVVGEAAYVGDSLPTVAADAALIAKTLTSEGFDVSENHDLDAKGLASAYQAFLAKVQAAPGASVMLYLGGLGVTVGCDDYLLPIDAQIHVASDVPPISLSMTHVMADLARTQAQLRIVSFDGSRPVPTSVSTVAFPKGLIPLDVPTATAFALGAEIHDYEAPPQPTDADDAYAPALAGALQQPFLDVDTTLEAARINAHQTSGGAQTPWHATDANMPPFAFVAGATPDQAQQATSTLPTDPAPIGSMGEDLAYWAAIWRNDIADYQAFLAAFSASGPADQVSRVQQLLALLQTPNPICQASAPPPPAPAPVVTQPQPDYEGPLCPDGFQPWFDGNVNYCSPIVVGTACPNDTTPVVVDGVAYCQIVSVCPPGSFPIWTGNGWICHVHCHFGEPGCPLPPPPPICLPWHPGCPMPPPPPTCVPWHPGCPTPPTCVPWHPGCPTPPTCVPWHPGCPLPPTCVPWHPGCPTPPTCVPWHPGCPTPTPTCVPWHPG